MDVNSPLHIHAVTILKLPHEERSVSSNDRFTYMHKHMLIRAQRKLPVRHRQKHVCLYRNVH